MNTPASDLVYIQSTRNSAPGMTLAQREAIRRIEAQRNELLEALNEEARSLSSFRIIEKMELEKEAEEERYFRCVHSQDSVDEALESERRAKDLDLGRGYFP